MKFRVALSFFIFAAAHVYLASGPIRDFSPTYDEPIHLAAGAAYWEEGNIRLNGTGHPPFAEAWAALPLIWMDPVFPRFHPLWAKQVWTPRNQYRFADIFLYRNKIQSDRLIRAGRWSILVLSILMGALVVWGSYQMGGWKAAAIGGGLWAFSPTMLAHGTLVTTDLAFALFFFGFFLFLHLAIEAPLLTSPPKGGGIWNWILAGASLGLCFGSKYLAVAIGPVLLVWAAVSWKKIRPDWKRLLFCAAAAVFLLVLVFRGQMDIFFEGIRQTLFRAQSGRSSYFWGDYRVTGWLSYFPAAFLLKTPVAVLLGLAVAVGVRIAKKDKWPALLWIAPAVFFAIACVSRVQIGHRHILAVYPFLFLFIGVTLAGFERKNLWIPAILVLFLAGTTWASRPYFLSYFNLLAGGSEKGARYFTDSNIDWGQGLKRLSEALPEKEKEKGIYLTYFGTADPRAVGIRYIDVGSDDIAGHTDDRNDPSVRPDFYAISVTHAKGTYYADKNLFDWLENFEPVDVIAHSIVVYDFTHEPEAKRALRNLIRD